jgi:chaperonin GroEL
MAKQILSGVESRREAVTALDNITNIVASTVGPGGRPILLTRNISSTTSSVFHTKDGISVLRELSYTDPVYDAVHKLAIQATADTVMASGDGTSSTLIMAAAFARAFFEYSNENPQSAIRAYRKEVLAAVDCISKETRRGSKEEDAVALTSTNRDRELTDLVIKAINQTSAYGTVLVEKNPMSKERFSLDKEFGYQAGSGYSHNITLGISVSDNAVTNGDFYLDNCYVVPYNGNIMQINQIKPMLEALYEANDEFNLLIIGYDVSEDVCNQIIVANRQNPGVKIFPCKTTPTAELNGPWNQLNDIAAFSGASIVDGGTAARWTIKDAGEVKKVRVTPYKTFMSGKSAKNWIEKRAEQNEESASKAPTPLDKDIINSRNASLTGGLVKISIGGGLPGDLQEIADRADDAIKAAQACRRSGALPGCGMSYIRAGDLAKVSEPVLKALSSVHARIMNNYGASESPEPTAGTTLLITENEISSGDFIELGIADSFETVKSVILNGFYLGSLIANIGGYCLNADLDEIQKQMTLKNIMLS